MADHAHDMGLMTVGIQGVAHRLTVDGKTGVVLAIGLIPASKGAVEIGRIDSNENIADDRFAGHQVAPVDPTATKPLSGLGAEALGPVSNRLVAAHATQDRPTSDGQHRSEGMASSLGTARVWNVDKEIWQRSHLLGAQHNLGYSLTIRGWQ